MNKKIKPTFDSEVLGVLAYEFSITDQADCEKKIKARLIRKKLGDFDSARISLLRKLKDEIKQEIGKGDMSKYFLGRFDKKYVDIRDFDFKRMISDTSTRFPTVGKREIENFVPFSILIYYLK